MLSYVLLGALVVVVVGSLAGEAASYKGWLTGSARPLFGAQGWEYLDLGRFWQVLLIVGMLLWLRHPVSADCARGWQTESRGNLPYLFFYSALSIPLFYAVGLLSRSRTDFAIADFWRFWVVHLWVEDFLELFTTIMVAYIFVLLGVVSEKTATRVIYLDALLYSVGGVVGTMHHLYFSGAPAVHMALGAFFSAAEVIPLTFLTVEAWTFLHLGARQQVGAGTNSRTAGRSCILVAVGFWNFLGAGVFGFLINLPMVSYFEIGTQLTANHGPRRHDGRLRDARHRLAGLLSAIPLPAGGLERPTGRLLLLGAQPGTGLDGLRQPFPDRHPAAWRRRGKRLLARPVDRILRERPGLEWLRLPGDVLFIAGVVPLVYLTGRAILRPSLSRAPRDPSGASLEGPLHHGNDLSGALRNLSKPELIA